MWESQLHQVVSMSIKWIGVGMFGPGLTPRAMVVGMGGRMSFTLVEHVSNGILEVEKFRDPHS